MMMIKQQPPQRRYLETLKKHFSVTLTDKLTRLATSSRDADHFRWSKRGRDAKLRATFEQVSLRHARACFTARAVGYVEHATEHVCTTCSSSGPLSSAMSRPVTRPPSSPAAVSLL